MYITNGTEYFENSPRYLVIINITLCTEKYLKFLKVFLKLNGIYI